MNAPPTTQNLRPCPDCGHSISVNAHACPECGSLFQASAHLAVSTQPEKVHDFILNHSWMMVGLCLTLLGFARLSEGIKELTTLADELLAANAVIFLISGLVSYLALKQPQPERKRGIGQIADIIFLMGIVVLVGICCVIAAALV